MRVCVCVCVCVFVCVCGASVYVDWSACECVCVSTTIKRGDGRPVEEACIVCKNACQLLSAAMEGQLRKRVLRVCV